MNIRYYLVCDFQYDVYTTRLLVLRGDTVRFVKYIRSNYSSKWYTPISLYKLSDWIRDEGHWKVMDHEEISREKVLALSNLLPVT